MSNNMRKRNGIAVAIALVLVAASGLGVYFVAMPAIQIQNQPPAPGMARTGLLRGSIVDNAGRNRTVEARFAFDLDYEAERQVPLSQLEAAAREAINQLSFDAVLSYGGLDHVREEIMSILAFYNVSPDMIHGIYVSDFAIGIPLPHIAGSPGRERVDELGARQRGLFQSLR